MSIVYCVNVMKVVGNKICLDKDNLLYK